MQLLLPDSGQPRGAGGAAGAPSARASRCSSQSLCWLQAAFLLMQQARAAKHWERRSGDKGCLSVAWASSRPAVWASRPGRKPHFCSWDFFLVSFRNLYHLVQELVCPSCQVGQQAPVMHHRVMLGIQQPEKGLLRGTGPSVCFSSPHSACAPCLCYQPISSSCDAYSCPLSWGSQHSRSSAAWEKEP